MCFCYRMVSVSSAQRCQSCSAQAGLLVSHHASQNSVLSPADDAPKGSDDEQRVGNYVVTKKDNLVLGREV